MSVMRIPLLMTVMQGLLIAIVMLPFPSLLRSILAIIAAPLHISRVGLVPALSLISVIVAAAVVNGSVFR